jgi:Fe-S-cluster containining protein
MDNYKPLTEEDVFDRRVMMTDNVKKIIIQQNNPSFTQFLKDMFLHYMNEFARNLYAGEDAYSITYSFQKSIDEIVNENPEIKNTTCAKQGTGCSFCCYINVDITKEEAKLLVDSAKENGVVLDTERMKLQSEIEDYHDLEYKNKKCVFLDYAGKCSVYEYRPMMCRKHYVVNPVEQCNTEEEVQETLSLVMNKAEIMTSAAFNSTKEVGRMSTMVLKQLNENTTNDIIPA